MTLRSNTFDRTQHWQALVFTVTCIQPLSRRFRAFQLWGTR